jgi:hypothetical protein
MRQFQRRRRKKFHLIKSAKGHLKTYSAAVVAALMIEQQAIEVIDHGWT